MFTKGGMCLQRGVCVSIQTCMYVCIWRVCVYKEGMCLHRKNGGWTNYHAIKYTYIHTSWSRCIHTDRHTHRHTYIHTDIQTYRHTDIHTDRQTYTYTYRQTDIHTYIQKYVVDIHTDIRMGGLIRT